MMEVAMLVDPEQLAKIERHLLRLARRDPKLKGHADLQALWATVFISALTGWMHSSLRCDGTIQGASCPQCLAVHQANRAGFDLGYNTRNSEAEAKEAPVKRSVPKHFH